MNPLTILTIELKDSFKEVINDFNSIMVLPMELSRFSGKKKTSKILSSAMIVHYKMLIGPTTLI